MGRRPNIRDKKTVAASDPNRSLSRGLAILESFSREKPELGVRELSRMLALNKSSVHRLVRTLANHGFLEQDATTSRYRVGAGAFKVGHLYLTATGLEEAAFPALRALAREHQLSAYLGVLRQGFVVHLIALQGTGPVMVRVEPGSHMYAHSTALGKVLLAAEPNDRVKAILGSGPLPRLTPSTLVHPSEVLRQLDEVRRRGYAVTLEENKPGVVAVGAPVRDRSGQAVAAISVASLRYQLPDRHIPRIASLVMAAADEISRNLGAQSDEPDHRRLSASPRGR